MIFSTTVKVSNALIKYMYYRYMCVHVCVHECVGMCVYIMHVCFENVLLQTFPKHHVDLQVNGIVYSVQVQQQQSGQSQMLATMSFKMKSALIYFRVRYPIYTYT